MPALPRPADPTLLAVDTELELAQDTKPRPYLGASIIGDPCQRKLWFQFRWAARAAFDAATLKRFEDGHAGEAVQARRLRMVPGIELWTEDENGNQFGFVDGHIRGHADGFIRGLKQAPKTVHVWEHKQVGEKSAAQLEKLKAEKGEKEALAHWNELYYAQAQVYMHYFKLTRHYLTCSTPGGRHTVSVRTNYDETHAVHYIQRAKAITTSLDMPGRLSDDPTHYRCKWCDFYATCHGAAGAIAPLVSGCRMCKSSRPQDDGTWKCARFDVDIPEDKQRLGCDELEVIASCN